MTCTGCFIARVPLAIATGMLLLLGGRVGADSGLLVEPEYSHGRLTLVAGGPCAATDETRIVSPFGVAFDSEKTLFFVEMTGRRVRKIGRDGLLTTVVGTGQRATAAIEDRRPRQSSMVRIASRSQRMVTSTSRTPGITAFARSMPALGSITNFAGTEEGVLGRRRARRASGIRRNLLPRPGRSESRPRPGRPR